MRLLVLAACLVLSLRAEAEAPPAVPVVDGEGLAELLQQHRSSALIVNVFASWCRPCVREFPYLDRLGRSYPDVHLLGVDLDDDPAALEKFLGKLKTRPSFSIVRKGKGDARPMLVRAGLLKKGQQLLLPTTLLFAAGGKLVRRIEGELDPEWVARDLGDLRASAAK